MLKTHFLVWSSRNRCLIYCAFNFSNALSQVPSQLCTSDPFFVRSVNGVATFAKFWNEVFEKLQKRKEAKNIRDVWGARLWTKYILFLWIRRRATIFNERSKNINFVIKKLTFLWIRVKLNFLSSQKYYLQMSIINFFVLIENWKIINVCQCKIIHANMKDLIRPNRPQCTASFHGHGELLKLVVLCTEGFCFNITRLFLHLMKPYYRFILWESFGFSNLIKHLFSSRNWCVVSVCEFC